MQIKKILVPTDLSPESERAFGVAEFAKVLDATVVLLHVIENVGVAPVGEAFPRPAYLPGTQEEIERARELLTQRRKRFPAGIEIVTDVVVVPSVPHGITDYAAEKNCDVIALSTHGRSGFRRLIMGSVAEAVLRHSKVPVLVFPRQN